MHRTWIVQRHSGVLLRSIIRRRTYERHLVAPSSPPHDQHVIRLPPNVHPKTIILAIPVTEITEKQSWELRTVNDVLCWLVPIRRESIKIALPSSLFVNKSAAQLPGGRLRSFWGFKCTQGYAFTFHSIQGQTLDMLALDLSPGTGTISWESIYVGITRVKKLSNLRLFKTPDFCFEIYRDLKPHPLCASYYNPNAWTPSPGGKGLQRQFSTTDEETAKSIGTKPLRKKTAYGDMLSLAPSNVIFTKYHERSSTYTCIARVLHCATYTGNCIKTLTKLEIINHWLHHLLKPKKTVSLYRPMIPFPSAGIGLNAKSIEELIIDLNAENEDMHRYISIVNGRTIECIQTHLKSYSTRPPTSFLCRSDAIDINETITYGHVHYVAVCCIFCPRPHALSTDNVPVLDSSDAICRGRENTWWWYIDGRGAPRPADPSLFSNVVLVLYTDTAQWNTHFT